MQIVIDIPEEMWERVKDGYVPLGISKYLKNGTVLPKEHGDLMLLNAEQMIHALPSVTSTQKYGKWIVHPEIETSTPEYLMFYECSECGDKQCFCKSDIHKKRFCSNCGAKMQESEDKE